MNGSKTLCERIIDSTEVRRHNGQCEYGEWYDLSSEDVPNHVREAVADEIADAMRRESESSNTEDSGKIDIGGQTWVYRR